MKENFSQYINYFAMINFNLYIFVKTKFVNFLIAESIEMRIIE